MGFLGVDAVVVRVPSLEAGLRFYRDAVGHELLWQRPNAAALRMGDSPTELVLMTDVDAETDLIVADLDSTLATVIGGGGRLVTGPLPLDVGRVAIVVDPFGNSLSLIELSGGLYETDGSGTVVGLRDRPPADL